MLVIYVSYVKLSNELIESNLTTGLSIGPSK